jgi:ATP-dependent DNA ligase
MPRRLRNTRPRGRRTDTLESVTSGAFHSTRPMPLIRVGAAFDHSDWIFELKHDGFRALAIVDGYACTLVPGARLFDVD